MSHFSLLIIGDEPEEQLKPFQQFDLDSGFNEYVVFRDDEDYLRKEWEEGTISARKIEDPEKYPDIDIIDSEEYGLISASYDSKLSGLPYIDIPAVLAYPSFETFCEEYHGYDERDEKQGRYGYWENPNSKWDWYELGGRWKNFLKIKTKTSYTNPFNRYKKGSAAIWVSQCFSHQIDWEGMERIRKEKAEDNWNVYQLAKSGEIKISNPRKVLGLFFDPPDKETYLAKVIDPTLSAILYEGEWIEPDTTQEYIPKYEDLEAWKQKFKDIVRSIPNSTLVSIYDCHT